MSDLKTENLSLDHRKMICTREMIPPVIFLKLKN